jgi:hypothetical protein
VSEPVQSAVEPVAETVATVSTPVAETVSMTGDAGTIVDPIVATADAAREPFALAPSDTASSLPPPDVGPTISRTPDLAPITTEPVSTLDGFVVPTTDSGDSLVPTLDELLSGIVPGPDTVAAVLPTAVGVGLAAGAAIAIARGMASPATPVLVTNVRLLPSYAGSAVERTGVAAVEVGSRLGSSVAAATGSALGSVVDPVRDGFGRTVRPVAGSDSLRDSRLLARIGIVLGTIYLAFLTLWFWLTRVRWNVRN